MNRIRRHRWRIPLSLLAMLALVWAQVVLSSHPACALSIMASSPEHAHHAEQTPSDQVPPHCHGAPDSGEALCASHCSQDDLSKDAPRMLSVPTLGHVPMMPVVVVRQLLDGTGHAVGARPRAARHRPTPHPASLLLI